jgi:hypothetical protein
LPPSSRGLSIAGRMRAFSMSVGRAVKLHEGLGAGYDTARRQLLAKMDDEAYQSFVQSFRFCHECRQFVCNECWSTSRRSCLTCVAKSMTGTVRPRPPFAPTGPEIPRPVVSSLQPVRKGRMRRDIALVALALAIVLVSLEAGILLVGAMPGGVASNTSASPTAQQTATPTPTPTDASTAIVDATDSATPIATATLPATPSASASATATTATPTPRRTAGPTGTPTGAPTPTPTPPPVRPDVSCSDNNSATPNYTLSCHISNAGSFLPGDTFAWSLNGAPWGSSGTGLSASWLITVPDGQGVQVRVTRGSMIADSIAFTYPS